MVVYMHLEMDDPATNPAFLFLLSKDVAPPELLLQRCNVVIANEVELKVKALQRHRHAAQERNALLCNLEAARQ